QPHAVLGAGHNRAVRLSHGRANQSTFRGIHRGAEPASNAVRAPAFLLIAPSGSAHYLINWAIGVRWGGPPLGKASAAAFARSRRLPPWSAAGPLAGFGNLFILDSDH